MKMFETPVVEVIKLQVMDVIATSTTPEVTVNPCPDDMGEF